MYRTLWVEIIRQAGTKANIESLQKQLDNYHDALKYDYEKNKHFKIKHNSAEIMLYDPITGDDYFKLTFKVIRPSKYTITCGIGSRRDSVVRHVSYSRTYGVDNKDYLFKQALEWIERFDAQIRPPAFRTANMKAGFKSRFESLVPLIDNLLRNLNEGNNL